MKKIFFCLLAVMVGVVGAKSFDASLLVGKTWQCDNLILNGENTEGKASNEFTYKKDGTFSIKGKLFFTKPQKYTLEIVETGTWKLEGDKLKHTKKTYGVTSKDAPEIAKMMEAGVKFRREYSEKYGKDEDEEIEEGMIAELTKNRLVFGSDYDNETSECKAK
ncbi:MAG: hypothetical protein LBS73_04540 [Campylobacteraceae bacterium]|jgi:hypothetical protein|nr:hypothetical protein [Campylobacteraceae bacterium]